ncbi:AmiS/UreI family transporter [Baekduia soli]|uniref:AmiS/UreI family transporter n=1 Tax=Baekduia soli TaxID=496014 RepID=UPI002AA29F22|nr:AmiS/UreI family transporter [Baekduia soli]
MFVNGLALVGLVRGTSMIPMNLFVGILQVVTPFYLIFTAHGDQGVIVGASGLFLFGFTYLYVAMNNAFSLDGTGLGWFCLFVAIAACVYSYWNFANYAALSPGDHDVGYLLGVLWASWAVLWLLFWFVLGLGKTGLTRFTGAWCAAQGIYTGLVPAIILLNIPSAITSTLPIVIGAVSLATFIIFLVMLKPRWAAVDAVAPPPTAYSGA